MLVEAVNHFLLLLVIVAIVEMLGLILLVELRTSFQSLIRVLAAELRLHIC